MTPSRASLLVVFSLCILSSSSALDLGRSSLTRSLLAIPSLDSVRASCKTKAKATLTITSGTGSASATSSCTAFAKSISSVKKVWDDYIRTIKLNPGQKCTVVEIEKVLQACATAVAKVYTSAQGFIKINGHGKACVDAKAEGDAYAKSFAYVFVNLWLGVTDGLNSAEAEAQVEAIAFALAEVWAKASVSACQKGSGYVAVAEQSYAAQVKVALACVFAEVSVKLCKEAHIGKASYDACGVCKEGELEKYYVATQSDANVKACSSTKTLKDVAKGNASTGDDKGELCKDKYYTCCGDFYKGAKTCVCGRGCTMTSSGNDHWKTAEHACHCPSH